MPRQKIKIRLRAYEPAVLDKAAEMISTTALNTGAQDHYFLILVRKVRIVYKSFKQRFIFIGRLKMARAFFLKNEANWFACRGTFKRAAHLGQ